MAYWSLIAADIRFNSQKAWTVQHSCSIKHTLDLRAFKKRFITPVCNRDNLTVLALHKHCNYFDELNRKLF